MQYKSLGISADVEIPEKKKKNFCNEFIKEEKRPRELPKYNEGNCTTRAKWKVSPDSRLEMTPNFQPYNSLVF